MLRLPRQANLGLSIRSVPDILTGGMGSYIAQAKDGRAAASKRGIARNKLFQLGAALAGALHVALATSLAHGLGRACGLEMHASAVLCPWMAVNLAILISRRGPHPQRNR